MKKPVIRITWSKMHPEDMNRFNLKKQLPIYSLKSDYGLYCTGNPNDLLCAIICFDIGNNDSEYSPLMQIGNKSLVWGGEDWVRVIDAPLPKYPSLDPRDNPNP